MVANARGCSRYGEKGEYRYGRAVSVRCERNSPDSWDSSAYDCGRISKRSRIGKAIAIMRGHRGQVTGVTFSPDARPSRRQQVMAPRDYGTATPSWLTVRAADTKEPFIALPSALTGASSLPVTTMRYASETCNRIASCVGWTTVTPSPVPRSARPVAIWSHALGPNRATGRLECGKPPPDGLPPPSLASRRSRSARTMIAS